MSSQKQEAGAGAIAIQGQGDVTVYQGLSPNDMATIMSALARQMPAYAAMAREIVDARLQEFQERVLERFASTPTANPNAFADPDFQYGITIAQHAFARSGDPVIRDTLVDLIERRSRETTRTRLALTLNEAMERSAYLTREEFAELTLVYLIKCTTNGRVINMATFKEHLHTAIFPLLSDISKEQASYQFIEAQSCGSIETFVLVDLHQYMTHTYGGVFSKGFSREQLESRIPGKDISLLEGAGLIGPCLNDPGALQLLRRSQHEFMQDAASTGLPTTVLEQVSDLFKNSFWNKDELLDHVGEPLLRELYSLWEETPLHSLVLTAVGIAIGHANATRVCSMDADLSVWIK